MDLEKRGLGLGNVVSKNSSEMRKWLWRFLLGSFSEAQGDQQQVWLGPRPTPEWHADSIHSMITNAVLGRLVTSIEFFLALVRYSTEVGGPIRFWEDLGGLFCNSFSSSLLSAVHSVRTSSFLSHEGHSISWNFWFLEILKRMRIHHL